MSRPLDRVQQTVSGTPGTGNVTLGTAVAGYQTFAQANAAVGDVVPYLITDVGNGFEFGWGTLTGLTTLVRTTILGSSNSGAAITATSAAIVTSPLLAEDLVALPVFNNKFFGGI